jgi:molybdopterin/thiamine biosynthesis adenylyltransferase
MRRRCVGGYIVQNKVIITDEERRRYGRQLLLPEVKEVGQLKLKQARVLVVGAGGLGAASLSYLAASGVGKIGIMDNDYVELSNLNRQIIHETGDIGRLKVHSSQNRINEINPNIEVQIYAQKLTAENANIISDYDLVVDGCDNFATRYVINAACLRAKVPWIYGAVAGFKGQIAIFQAQPELPCYRCFVPNEPHTRNDCAYRGVMGAAVGVIGAMQAMEAIKMLLDIKPPHTKIMRYDGLKSEWKSSILRKDLDCEDCSG